MPTIKSLLLCAIILPAIAWATVDQYAFTDADQHARFMALAEELRCPKCQNQTLSDSNAEIAKDLRDEIYRLIQLGKTDEQIVQHLVDRYGEFVRYKPPVNNHTAVLWWAPAILLLLGLIIVVAIGFRSRPVKTENTSSLSDEEKQRLAQLTKDND